MAFDAEWYQSGDRNVVLSYQIATVSRSGSQNIIEFVPPGKRLKLAEIVMLGVCSVNGGSIPDNHTGARNLVILISHSTVAEWSVLADRDAPYIRKQLTAIRKSPVTSNRPIEIVLGDYICLCDVQLYDTRLIAPADFQSLKKLSTMLGSDDELKVEIGHHHIKRMNHLLRIDYKLYEKYALQDSEITLKLFFLLQSTLMELAGYDLKIYRTLASGAVKGFLRRAPCFDFYQDALKARCFKAPFNFLRSAYHGGRNEGILVGRSDRYPEISDRLWADVDFVGCYPTAMSVVPTIDCGINPFFGRPRGKMRKVLIERVINPVTGRIQYLPPKYSLPEMTVEELREAKISKEHYDKTRKILNKITPDTDSDRIALIMREFDTYLGEIKSKSESERLRTKALVYDNSLVDSWYERWNSRDDNNDQVAERFIVPGFAKVDFAFDKKMVDGKEVVIDAAEEYVPLFPCLPVPHASYGLLYPLRGVTFATAPEIMLAMDTGCLIKVIESLELPVVMSDDGHTPKRLFFDHLKDLTVKRNVQKRIKEVSLDIDERQKATVLERFIKEFMNSFYGKTAQAVNYKKVYDPETGRQAALGPSQISESCTAALATGLPRSALSAVLLAVDRYNLNKPISKRIIVASCTTDGCLLGLPRPEGLTAASYYQIKHKTLKEPVVAGVGGGETVVPYHTLKDDIPKLDELLTTCGCGDLFQLIETYMPIRQMKNARRELTTDGEGKFDDTFLEIKHFADQIAGIKTRGQIGWMNINGEKIVTIQAKFGLKPPVTDIIEKNNLKDCMDNLDPILSMKLLDAEYDRIMNVGETVKASLECNWILDQIDGLKCGETDVLEYTFYGLKSFNEIIKGGDGLDLTQTKDSRIFNADFDWKRKLVMIDDVLSPFSIPHLDKKEMRSYRGLVEKIHRHHKIATPEVVIQEKHLAYSKTSNRGGTAAKLVRHFLYGMLYDYIPGGVKKVSSNSKKSKNNNVYRDVADNVAAIWNELDFKFEPMALSNKQKEKAALKPAATKSVIEEWNEDKVTYIARQDKWVPNGIPPTADLERLLNGLCRKFNIEYEIARKKIFATRIVDEPDMGLVLPVVLAILKAPGQGVEPFKTLYNSDMLPTRDKLIRRFHPHLSEALLASHEHTAFQKGQCLDNDRNELEGYFVRSGMSIKNAVACVQVLLPENMERETVVSRYPGQVKCVRLFALALRTIEKPPVDSSIIIKKLRYYGLDLNQFFKSMGSKLERHSIKNDAQNIRFIKKLAKLFSVDANRYINEMVDK